MSGRQVERESIDLCVEQGNAFLEAARTIFLEVRSEEPDAEAYVPFARLAIDSYNEAIVQSPTPKALRTELGRKIEYAESIIQYPRDQEICDEVAREFS